MLTEYQNRVNWLLQTPTASPSTLYPAAFLLDCINQARGQLAGESQSILTIGTVTTVIGQRNYNFSSLNLGTPSVTGIQGAMNVSRIHYGVASGQKFVVPRPWEYFDQYYMNNPVPVNGYPQRWSQLGQGSAGIGAITGIGSGSMSSGSFYLDPPPDAIYTLYVLCACYPIALALDTDVESLPWIWTDAVAYFAAYLALLSAQSGQREGEASRMLDRYGVMVERARKAANPDRLKWIFQGAPDAPQLAKFNLQGKGAA